MKSFRKSILEPSFNKTKCINQFDSVFVYQRYTRAGKIYYFPVIISSFVFAILINKRLQTNNFVCNLYEQEYSSLFTYIYIYHLPSLYNFPRFSHIYIYISVGCWCCRSHFIHIYI